MAVRYFGMNLAPKVTCAQTIGVSDLQVSGRQQKVYDKPCQPKGPRERKVVVRKHVLTVCHHAKRNVVLASELWRGRVVKILVFDPPPDPAEDQLTVCRFRMIAVPNIHLYLVQI